MPSTATITSFYSFTALTGIKSAEVNANFSNFRGHLVPINTDTATSSDITHDLGSEGHSWRGVYSQYGVMYENTASSVPATPSSGKAAIYFKNDGNLYKKNSSGVETQIDVGASSVTPTGSIVMYGGASAPSGWLMCDGSSVSRTTYSSLFSAIGTAFGAGATTTEFHLPNTQGIFVRGAGSQTISSITFSGTLGTKQADQMQGHRHPLATATNAGGGNSGNNASGTGATAQQNSSIGDPSSDGANGTPRTGTETRPANIALNYIIKT